MRSGEFVHIGTFDKVDKESRASGTVDISRIVAKEDTAE
jgi:hypothetical protein